MEQLLPPSEEIHAVDISGDIKKLYSMGLLSALLEDKATNQNITWSTDQYEKYGSEYAKNQPIKPGLIDGTGCVSIQIRALKPKKEKEKRVRKRGEVFTPIETINNMNTCILRDAYESAGDWKQFIDFSVLEITCGEGPFLATRYDTITGMPIPLSERVGLLDAKIREANANAEDNTAWEEWVVRAFESTYGYEYQGDSLLIARVNMLMTFIEYFKDRWGHEPDCGLLNEIAKRVVWNLWQMDGLTGRVPDAETPVFSKQTASLFDLACNDNLDAMEHTECLVYDWKEDRAQKWSSL